VGVEIGKAGSPIQLLLVIWLASNVNFNAFFSSRPPEISLARLVAIEPKLLLLLFLQDLSNLKPL
jgi:hypothetical protein